jgi:hypothetical protein
MEGMLEDLSQRVFGRSRSGDQCVTCGSTKIAPSDFEDDLSRKEFGISHMCQECQNSVFGGQEEEDAEEMILEAEKLEAQYEDEGVRLKERDREE